MYEILEEIFLDAAFLYSFSRRNILLISFDIFDNGSKSLLVLEFFLQLKHSKS
jgi:hypothetical protein